MGHGSSRGVLLAKEFWELLSTGRIFGFLLATLLAVGTSASAADLTGTVVNGTTHKPAAGDEVVLLTLSNGAVSESARAKTDGAGRFRFTIPDPPAPRLVRVVHQGIAYERIVQPGANSVAVQVFDVAKKLDGITGTLDVQRFQATGDTLQVIEQIAVRNASNPPRTLMKDRSFEIQLPPEAQVDSAMAQPAGGQPLTTMPTPGEQKGRYYISFPLRPGYTRFQFVYRLPYRGEAVIEPRILYPLEQFVVALPKSMKFEAKTAGIFQPTPAKTGDNVQMTAAVKPGQPLAFRVSGTGTLAELQGGQQEARGGQTASPGGGPGPPTKSPTPPKPPTPLRDSYILVGLAVVLAAGAVYVYVARRSAVARARARNAA